MVKSEQEIIKVIKALSMLFISSTYKAYVIDITPEEFMKGLKAKISLTPGQSTDVGLLLNTTITCHRPEDMYIPSNGYISETMKEFTLAIRKVFTSIHEYKKDLSLEIKTFPSEQDLSWALSVARSYNVTPVKEYVASAKIPDMNAEAIFEIGVGDSVKQSMKLIVEYGWFIEKMEGLEEFATPEENRAKYKPGLTFREL